MQIYSIRIYIDWIKLDRSEGYYIFFSKLSLLQRRYIRYFPCNYVQGNPLSLRGCSCCPVVDHTRCQLSTSTRPVEPSKRLYQLFRGYPAPFIIAFVHWLSFSLSPKTNPKKQKIYDHHPFTSLSLLVYKTKLIRFCSFFV